MKRTTLCPCGSGKPQARCCGDNPKAKINLRAIVTWSFIILLGGAITVIAFTVPSDEVPITNVGATPAPYQYNPITNKYWDPSHAHWHDGRPPVGAGAANGPLQLSDSNGATAPAISSTIFSSPGGASATSSTGIAAPPNITNPTPWQYDVATDRHYDPGHGHWHFGRPPNDPSAAARATAADGQVPAPSNSPSAQPWQYDTATDRHFDPNHGHWHSGLPPTDRGAVKPPAPGDRVPAPPNVTNPSPWQYDAATDRHYDPNHGHWHSGPPTGEN